MAEQTSHEFSEKIFGVADTHSSEYTHEHLPQDVAEILSRFEPDYRVVAQEVSEMLSMFEPFASCEDGDGNQYWYYVGSNREKSIDVVLTCKKSPNVDNEWFLGLLPDGAVSRLSLDEIMDIADSSAVAMRPEDLVEWLYNALSHSHQEDRRKLKKMEEERWEEPELVTVEQVPEESTL